MTEWRRRQSGHLTKRHARRELAALEDRLKDELAAHDEAAKKEYERIRDEHNARGMLDSSFRLNVQAEAGRAASRRRAELVRNYEVERDRLRDLVGDAPEPS